MTMSTWTFTDKRGDVDAPSDGERLDAETDRQRRRHELRLALAKMELAKDNARLLQAEVDAINARCDAAADLHASTCEPLQQRLEKLERRAISRIASRSPANPDEDEERRELIASITSANRELEATLQREHALRKPLEQRIIGLETQYATIQAVRNRLAQAPLACPLLLIEAHIADCRLRHAGVRVAAAHRALRIVSANIDAIAKGLMSRADLPSQRVRRDKWLAEVSAAESEQQSALAAAEALGQKMIDE